MNGYTFVESPIGPLLLGTDGEALIRIDMHVPSRPPRDLESWTRDSGAGPLPEVARQLDEYFSGRRRKFDLPIRLMGTDFQRRAWTSLMEIPYGETRSYGEQARRIGSPSASRAVGLANGRNPIPIVVPCHRVIGADGSLTGYAGGLENKRALLDLERGIGCLDGVPLSR
jgi:methylated-DNA-[protein]-cysteine S-methyltransferase